MPAEQGTLVSESTSASREQPTRLHFVDRIRVALTILVVLHHIAVTYGNLPGWYYQEPTGHPTAAVLDFLVTFDQSFFMGFFFLISAYFVPDSYRRKGSGKFLRERLLRLGVPLLVFYFVLSPLASMGTLHGTGADRVSGLSTWEFYLLTIGAGPLWFVEVLLAFSAGYVVWRRIAAGPPTAPLEYGGLLGYRAVALFVLGLTVVTFVWRIVIPMGLYIPILGLTTASHLPQYLGLFVVGLLAHQRGWFQRVPSAMGWWGLGAAVAATLILYPVALLDAANLSGGPYWASLAFSAWEAVVSVGVCLGVLTFARDRFQRQGALGRFLSEHAFGVFLLHAPILVGLALLLSGLVLVPIAKFGLLALIAVPSCFAAAFLVRRVPAVRKIL